MHNDNLLNSTKYTFTIFLCTFFFIIIVNIKCLSNEINEESTNHSQTNGVMTDVWQNVMFYLPIKDRLTLGTCSKITNSSLCALPYMVNIESIKRDLNQLYTRYPKAFIKGPERVVSPSTLCYILSELADFSVKMDKLLRHRKEMKKDRILYNYIIQINNHLSKKTKCNLRYFVGHYPLRASSETKEALSYLQRRVDYKSQYRPPLSKRLANDPAFFLITATVLYLIYFYCQPEPKEIVQNCGLDRKCQIVSYNNSRTFEVNRYHCYDREPESLIIHTYENWMSYLYENLKCNVTALKEFFQDEYARERDYFLQESVGINLYDETKETEVRWYKFAPHMNGKSRIYIYQNPRECLDVSEAIAENTRRIPLDVMLYISVAYFVFGVYYSLFT